MAVDWLSRARERFAGTTPRHDRQEWLLPGLTQRQTAAHRDLFPASIIPAAVLVPLVAHPVPTILLTQRSSELRRHAGQISFPGGRIEEGDESPAAAALRETREEIGLEERFVEVAGYLPDHILLTGFRVTPVVAIVQPGFTLRLQPTEVQDCFEVPLPEALDPANQQLRRRVLGELTLDIADIRYGERTIWGATAGMLLCLGRVLEASAHDGS